MQNLPIESNRSTDAGKQYKDIKDYLCMFDISGMYVYIMRTNKFPYDKDRYATKFELEKYNELISKKKYDELLKIFILHYVTVNLTCMISSHHYQDTTINVLCGIEHVEYHIIQA